MNLGQRQAPEPQDRRTAAHHSRGSDFGRVAVEFERLRALPPAHRADALAEVERTDASLAHALAPLLAQHDDDPDALGSPARWCHPAFFRDALAAADGVDELPERIGAYKPVRELGRGGMGSVYLAVRDGADFDQQVAVKILRALPGDRDVVRRFANERRILAALKHPNIASLVDGGTTDQGLPFVVMEYVDGKDLITHCRERHFGIEQRLCLFVKVCRAVAHAHRGLVVHRDLKPGNILVTADDEPKLLDFGIAKLLDHDDEDGGDALTRTGHLLLTPEYSSPEQVRGEAITTATDVYALGAVLYELLCGERAQPLTSRSLDTLLAVICERIPPPPSASIRLDSVTHRWSRRLRGDLDTIVAMAMRKEPERRYPSAEALADDLVRHLEGLPVRARTETFGYRLASFVRRHRAATAAACGIALLLVAFGIHTALQNRRIRAERDAADATAAFLVELFEMATPQSERSEGLRAREILDRGARRITDRLETDPSRRANLQLSMGRAYVAIGGFAEAEQLLLEAHDTIAAAEPQSSRHRRAQFWLGVARAHVGSIEAGLELMQASLQPGEDGERVPVAEIRLRHVAVADWLRQVGRFDEAMALLDRAGRMNAPDAESERDAAIGLRLARAAILREHGQIDESLSILLEVETSSAIADAGPESLSLHRELGRDYRSLDRLDEARAHFERALHLSRLHSGESHPDVDEVLFELAMLAEDAGDLKEAERLLRDVLERDHRRFGAEHAVVALDQAQLAKVLGKLEHHEEAERLFRTALAVQRRVLPKGHPELPTTIGNLAVYLHRNRRLDEAEELLLEQLELCRSIHGEEHAETVSTLHNLGVLRLDRGDAAGAERDLRAVLAAKQRLRGQHSETANTWLALATALSRQQRQAEAIEAFVGARDLLARTLGPDHPGVAKAKHGLGIAYMRSAQPEAAEREFRDAAAIAAKAFGESHSEWFYAQLWLARSLVEQQRLDEALPVAAHAFDGIEAARGDPRLAGWLRDTLADVHTSLGQPDRAEAVRRRIW